MLVQPLQSFDFDGDTFYVITPDNSFEDILVHMVHEVDSSAENLEDGIEHLQAILRNLLPEEGNSV